MSLSAGRFLSAIVVLGGAWALGGACAFGQQINIDFQAQCPAGVQSSGPCSTNLQAVGPGMPVTVQTSVGPVLFQGGVMVDAATNNLVSSGPNYATAFFGSSGYSPAITITLPTAVTNFFLSLINGQTYTETYTVSDNAGHSSSFSLPANTNSGVQGVSFVTVGTVVTVSTTDPNWDFSIYNISFVPLPPNPVAGVTPNLVSFSTPVDGSTTFQQSIEVQNSGSGSLSFTASVVSGSSWVSISPNSGNASLDAPAGVVVTLNASGLSPGSYRDVIHFSYPAQSTPCYPGATPTSCDVPVTLFVAKPGPSITATPVGVLFNVAAGAGSSAIEPINIADTGSPGTAVAWSAGPALNSGLPTTDFLAFGITNGQAQPGQPGSLPLSLNGVASTLAPGVYYELVQISDQNSQNSPQYVTAVLNIVPAPSSVVPQVTPAGLLFVGQVGRPIVSQQFTVNWSASQAQVFKATALTAPGLTWLKSDTGGVAFTNNPAVLTVSVSTAGLSAGVYSGSVSLSASATGAALGAVNVTLILGSNAVVPESQLTGAHPATVHRQTPLSNCTPSAVVLTETGIPSNFSVPAGWPANLVATMTDDCGNVLEGGSVAANFSNGDSPLSLADQGSGGQYIATWQPSNLANTIITLYANAGALKSSSSRLAGVVTANLSPRLNPNGIVDGFTFSAGGALAPGTVASAFGGGLATSNTPASPPTVPTAYQGTQLVVGGFLTPLYYVSPTQLNVEIPPTLRALQQYPAVGVVGSALTLPVTVTVVPMAPGVAAYPDGSAIAQHSNFTLVNSASPAHPGESLMIYLVGMGATNPAVASGQPAPGLNLGDTLASATTQPVVMVANQTAQVLFAGLTPGAIGLYQINFTVPGNVSAGSLTLTVTQGTVAANTTTLPVAVP